MASEASHEMNISIVGNSNGRHYINVQALADTGDGNPMSRIFSIPVQAYRVKRLGLNLARLLLRGFSRVI